MRAVIQRVMKANVAVGGEIISSIEQGLCVLIGITHNDTEKDMEYIARKILNLRIFDGENGKRWHCNVMEKELEVLCVSQFTLYGTLKGNKPDFHNAMPGDKSKEFYHEFLKILEKNYKPEKIKGTSVFLTKRGSDISTFFDPELRMKSVYNHNHSHYGEFAAYMQVSIQNDGPVTMEIESPFSKSSQNNPNV